MRFSAIVLLLLAACGSDPTGSSDATTSTTNDATTTSEPTDATNADATEATGADATTTPNDVQVTFSIETGSVTIAEPCGGKTFEVPFTVTGDLEVGTSIEAELSNGNGVFTGNVVGSTAYTGANGVVTATIPGDVRYFPGYRVRVRAAGVAASDSGNVFELSSGPDEFFNVYFPRSFGTVNGEYTAEADVGRAAGFAWQLGDGASPATSNDAAPTWSYTTTGRKRITLTARDELGCERTEEVFSPIDVFGCDFVLPSDVTPLRGSGELEFGVDAWICAGGDYDALGGRKLVVVEPAGRFEWRGGGQYGVVVRAGGTYLGEGSRDVVLYETGASIIGAVGELVECPTLTIDYDNAPENGCVSDGPPTIATLDALPGAACPNTEYAFTFTATGAPAPDNQYLVQLSNDDGTFSNPETIGSLASDALTGSIMADIADLDPTKPWAVRIIATNPSGIGPSRQLPVATVAEAGFTVSSGTPFIDEDITVTDTTLGAHQNVQWDFGAGAVATVLSNTATVHWTTGGDKVVTMTALDASGCPLEVQKTVKVVGCEVTMPANTRVVTNDAGFISNAQVPTLVCANGRAKIINGSQPIYVMQGGALEFFNGGDNTFYVEAGAAFTTSFADEGLLISEPGALLYRVDDIAKRSCEALTLDTSLMASACPNVQPTPPSLTVGSADPLVCPGATLEVLYTQSGLFGFDSTLTLQISDASGSFASPIATSTTKTATAFSITVPTSAPAGSGYKLRLVATNPSVMAESSSAFTIPSTTIPTFTLSTTKTLTGSDVTLTPNPSTTPVTWSFSAPVSIGGGPTPEVTHTSQGPLTAQFTTPGTTTVTLALGTGQCTQTTSQTLEVYSCNPTLPGDSIVATANASGQGGGLENVLVCDGVSYGGGGGAWTLYVEPGATGTFSGGGSWTFYVPNGATLSRSGGSNILTIIKGPSATLTNVLPSAVVLACPNDVTFDTSALTTQCP